MLNNPSVYAVFPAKDVERLKRFFREKLGLKPTREDMGIAFYESGGSQFFIYNSASAVRGLVH